MGYPKTSNLRSQVSFAIKDILKSIPYFRRKNSQEIPTPSIPLIWKSKISL
jgi:hypothetical protein